MRGHRQRPSAGVVIAMHHKNAVTIEGKTTRRNVGWPIDDVFEFDEELLGELKAAYAANDRRALESLWLKARGADLRRLKVTIPVTIPEAAAAGEG